MGRISVQGTAWQAHNLGGDESTNSHGKRLGREYLQRNVLERSAREYLRISVFKSEKSEDQQHDENLELCTEWGVTLHDPYREARSASASKFAQKERDDFQRLLKDLKSGDFGADALVMWESSRGSRQIDEWSTLLRLCEAAGVTIIITSHEREYDPANPHDRTALLGDALKAEHESLQTSQRVTRDNKSRAAQGAIHGKTCYGYVREYSPTTGKYLRQVPHPEEAAVVVELFERLEKHHSLYRIAKEFAARGIKNHSDRPFTKEHLRDLALNPAYAGIRSHQPKKIREKGAGLKGGRHRGLRPDVMHFDAEWPALISRTLFLSVEKILNDPERKTTRGGKAKHLMSAVAKCGVCEAMMAARYSKNPEGEYQCQIGGHVRCNKAELDAYGERLILEFLADEKALALMAKSTDDEKAEIAAVREELKDTQAHLRKLRRLAGDMNSGYSAESLGEVEPEIKAEIKRLEKRLVDLETPNSLLGIIKPGPDVAERWALLPIESRRVVARAMFVPEYLGKIYVSRESEEQRLTGAPISQRIRQTPDGLISGGRITRKFRTKEVEQEFPEG